MSQHERLEEDDPSLAAMLEGVLAVLIRRRWWILLAACPVALAAAGVVLALEDRYTSEATLVMQQQVLHQYVSNTAATPELVQAMTRQVLSRANLVGVINQMNLYSAHRERGAQSEDLVGLMREDIEISSLDPFGQSDMNAFKIAFTANDPRVAQMVTGRLTQHFIDENLRNRENVATNTSKFLMEQLEAAKEKMLEQERRVREFQARHPSSVAGQQVANTTALAEMRLQLQATRNGLRRLEQQRANAEYSVLQLLARLEGERAALLERYTPRHADVVKKDAEIARARAVLQLSRNETPSTGRPHPSEISESVVLSEVLRQVDSTGREMEELIAEERQLKSEIERLQGRLNMAPVREQELAAIQHEFGVYKLQYTELLNKHQQSQMNTSLEEGRESVQFRLIDPPTLPASPSSPNRLKLSLAGAAAGMLLGLGLAWLVDARDRSFRSLESLRRSFAAPLVVEVPTMSTPREQHIGRWKRVIEWAVACALVVAVLGAELYVYRHG
jgi:polysaccharide biosynthesis transport protein